MKMVTSAVDLKTSNDAVVPGKVAQSTPSVLVTEVIGKHSYSRALQYKAAGPKTFFRKIIFSNIGKLYSKEIITYITIENCCHNQFLDDI